MAACRLWPKPWQQHRLPIHTAGHATLLPSTWKLEGGGSGSQGACSTVGQKRAHGEEVQPSRARKATRPAGEDDYASLYYDMYEEGPGWGGEAGGQEHAQVQGDGPSSGEAGGAAAPSDAPGAAGQSEDPYALYCAEYGGAGCTGAASEPPSGAQHAGAAGPAGPGPPSTSERQPRNGVDASRPLVSSAEWRPALETGSGLMLPLTSEDAAALQGMPGKWKGAMQI